MRAFCVVLAGLLFAPCAGADTVYKCFDRNGRVVYQSQSCASTHLKDGGQIEPPAEVPVEAAERVRAETEKTRARLEAKKKAEEEARVKAQRQELEERRVQALERQAQAAEEQARAAERQARAAEEEARTPNVIVVPARPPAMKPVPRQPQRCAPGDWRCRQAQ
jgi:predicted ribosome quality control (RQC) complex YloA/Tae2 family protein